MPVSITTTFIIAALSLSLLTSAAPGQTNIKRTATPAGRPNTAPGARVTPSVRLVAGTYPPVSEILHLYGATNGSSPDSPFARAYHAHGNSKRSGEEEVIDDITNELVERWSPSLRATPAATTCVGSTNDSIISALFYCELSFCHIEGLVFTSLLTCLHQTEEQEQLSTFAPRPSFLLRTPSSTPHQVKS